MSYYTGPITDHFDGKRFYHADLPPTDKSLFDIFRWQLFGKHAKWPASVPAHSGVKPDPHVDSLRITHIGHASLLIQTARINILIDPVLSDRVSPFKALGPLRRNPPSVTLADLPHIHAVLVTHNHYDHMDTAALAAIHTQHKPVVISPLGNDTVIHKDAPQVPVQTGDWWQSFPLSSDVRATIVPAYHWSARKFADRRQALWCGFVLDTPSGCVYCAGDTAYQDGNISHEIRNRCGVPLVAILPIGAYEPRWFMSTQHTNPAEALQIATDIGAQHLLGIHWGTFALTDEPWDEPPRLLEESLRHHTGMPIHAQAMRPGDIWNAIET